MLVDPSSPESLWAANYYKEARQIPDRNVLYMDPVAADYPGFTVTNLETLHGVLQERGIRDHIDYIVVMPGTNFYVPASGYVADGCVGVFLHLARYFLTSFGKGSVSSLT